MARSTPITDRNMNGTRDPRVTVALDSGSHINAGGQRPAEPVRWSGWFGDRSPSAHAGISPTEAGCTHPAPYPIQRSRDHESLRPGRTAGSSQNSPREAASPQTGDGTVAGERTLDQRATPSRST